MGDLVNQQLGNYRLIRLLGRGGFAEVYLGEHRQLQSQAAIKVLQTSLEGEDEGSFLNEARIIANLEHPNIVRVFDFDVQEGTPFLVMSYAPNGSIRQRHPRGARLPLPTVVDYVRQIASALQYAHSKQLIHRDIKPENILVGRHQELLLSDFGIALIAQKSRSQSMQVVAGTASYMAPEQFQGKPRSASDQYALGIMVYEWLSGTRPFSGSFTEIASQHMFTPPPPLRTHVPDLPVSVEQVVMTALSKDTAQRFGSVQAFAIALEQSSQQGHSFPSASPGTETPPRFSSTPSHVAVQPNQAEEVTAPPSNMVQTMPATPLYQIPATPNTPTPYGVATQYAVLSPSPVTPPTVPVSQLSPTEQDQPPRRKVKRRAVIAGLGLVALAATGGGIYWAVAPRPPAEGTIFYTHKGHTEVVSCVAWSPDSKRIASGSWDTTVQIWDALNGADLFTYNNNINTVSCVAWSPDGKWIASADALNKVHVWSATDGTAVYDYKGHTNTVNAIAWSPDSKRIASASDDHTVHVWNAADGSGRFVYKGHTDFVGAVAWSPDGSRIASGGEGTDCTVQVWNATDGSAPFVYKGHIYVDKEHNITLTGNIKCVAWSPDGNRIASAADDQTVQVWDADDGSSRYVNKNHTGPVVTVAWSPDSKQIASAGADKTVQVWDAKRASTPYFFRGHSNIVTSVAWSPDGKYIASGSWDKTVKVWSAG